MKLSLRAPSAALLLALAAASALAAEPAEPLIRKTLAARLPNLKIDEISKSPIDGLYELRSGTDVFYVDERGEYLVQGNIIETKGRTDLTQARIDKLTAIDVDALPLKDAIVWKQGSGARKLVVFADPNCGYCKKFETDLQQVKDVTVYTFLMPILGGDSPEKSKNVWCAKDPATVWRSWMIHGDVIPRRMGACDTAAIDRNLALGKKYKITGTPSVVFADGKRVPGALPAPEVEKQLASIRPKG